MSKKATTKKTPKKEPKLKLPFEAKPNQRVTFNNVRYQGVSKGKVRRMEDHKVFEYIT